MTISEQQGVFRGVRTLLLGILLLSALWGPGVSPAFALEKTSRATPLRIGILAFRDIGHTTAQWAPTAEYLQMFLPGYSVRLIALGLDDLTEAVAARELDFVLTQPENYVILRTRYGLTAIATLMPIAEGRPVSEIGGVIFTRADRTDIRSLADLRGKIVVAPAPMALGGYRAQQWTLFKAGIEIPQDVADVRFTGQPQDQVVRDVLSGKGDVGFVRTGLLESMIREGRLKQGELRVINQQESGLFPQMLSTELYPEWAFAATKNVSEPVAKEVMQVLLGIPPESLAAQVGQYYGFGPPSDYQHMEAMLLRLNAHPDRFQYFGVSDIIAKYTWPIVIGLVFLGGFLIFIVFCLIRLGYRARLATRQRALLLTSLGEGVFGVDENGVCTFVNPAALNMLGRPEADLLGVNPHPVLHATYQDGSPYPYSESPLYQTLCDGELREHEEYFWRGDGTSFPARICVTPMLDAVRIVGAVVAFQDISSQKRTELDLRIAAVAFEAQEGIMITDAKNRIVRVNKAFTKMTGFTPEEAIGATPTILNSGYHDSAFYQAMRDSLQKSGSWKGEIWNRRKNGEVFPEWLTISVVYTDHGAVGHYVATFLDISQSKAAEERIQYLAFYDTLTRLPNRTLLLERLGQAVASSIRSGRHGALIFIDLDQFRVINDTLGYDMGDRLLVQASERLQACVREVDTVARLGGDEFVVMVEELDNGIERAAIQVELIAEKIRNSLNQPYLIDGMEHHYTPSIGITLFREQDEALEELLKRAEMAMYQAKSTGGNGIRFYDPAMQAAVEISARLEAELRQAIRHEEFVLHYQLQFSAAGIPVGAEALIRWMHPKRGLVGPGAFIALAEQNGLIVSMGQWVLRTACQQLATWQKNPETAHLRLAVNVSARQFGQDNFPSQVISALVSAGAYAEGLRLELTESLLLQDTEGVIRKMDRLRELGVGFSLDDFGTGYSSLAYLKRLRLEELKIDRSFVRDILDDPNDAAITSTIITLGETLGLTVVAEGVETQAQMEFLLRQGCPVFQGYYLAPPAAISELSYDATHVFSAQKKPMVLASEASTEVAAVSSLPPVQPKL